MRRGGLTSAGRPAWPPSTPPHSRRLTVLEGRSVGAVNGPVPGRNEKGSVDALHRNDARHGVGSVISLKPMSVGDGYKYLTGHVARGDVDQPAREGGASRLTSYYAASGYPPGVWLGSGLAGLDGDELTPGTEVEEWRMAALFAEGRDPTSGRNLGRAPNRYRSSPERVAAALAALPDDLDDEARAQVLENLERAEPTKATRTAKAGFDLTFTVPKSVSALWAIADEPTRAAIADAHHDTLTDMVDYLEREVIFTRVGHAGVAQVDTQGIVAAAFDHWDSRGGDPNLHTHLAVANRVQTAEGNWLTIDSRGLHHAVVAVSELYDATLADRLTRRLGVGWEPRERATRHTIAREVGGISEELITEFSSRSAAIQMILGELVDEFVTTHGRQPDRAEHIGLRQQATLSNRPVKRRPKPLDDLVQGWRHQAANATGRDPIDIVADALDRSAGTPLRAEQVPDGHVGAWAELTVAAVQARRSTWNRWNLMTETLRLTAGLRFASTHDREAFTTRLTDAAEERSISLQPDTQRPDTSRFHRRNGEDVFAHHASQRYSSDAVLGAEHYLVGLTAHRNGPTVDVDPDGFGRLSDDQRHAVTRLAASGNQLDVLIGPAGTGKTTTLSALRDQWVRTHGPDSVIGLAPSAAAAEVLAASLGVSCENTAKWIHESIGPGATARNEAQHRVATARRRARSPQAIARLDDAETALADAQQRWRFSPDQLVIIDEASLAGTLDLAAIAHQAEAAHAKILLVGDHAQLSSVEAGGALRMLAANPDTVELTSVWRFANDWERTASLALREGNHDALDTYERHGRITEGSHADMLDAAYDAWRTDTSNGRTSLLIAADNATVNDLNQRAQADLIATGQVTAEGIELRDGSTAGAGDRIVTRRNNRRLSDQHGWVHNGDIFQVVAVTDNGSLAVQRETDSGGAADVFTLPSDYVQDHVALAYATTAHRAQGMTVDTSHTLATTSQSREVLYVAATRGRSANHIYAALDTPGEDPDDAHHIDQPDTGRAVLEAVLTHSDAEEAAVTVATDNQSAAQSMATLIPIYEHIAQQLSEVTWTPALGHIRTDTGQPITTSPSWSRLTALLRTVSLTGTDAHQLVTNATADLPTDHPDPASVLLGRVSSAFNTTKRTQPVDYLVGLVVPAEPVDDPALQAAVDHAAQAISQRASELVDTAITNNDPWIRAIGDQPADLAGRGRWRQAIETVAAYRDRWNVTAEQPLGSGPVSDRTRQRDHRRARTALDQLAVAHHTTPIEAPETEPAPAAQRTHTR